MVDEITKSVAQPVRSVDPLEQFFDSVLPGVFRSSVQAGMARRVRTSRISM